MSVYPFMPANGGCVLPIARLGRLECGWFIEGPAWTMQPRGAVTLGQARHICVTAAAALRPKHDGGGMATADEVTVLRAEVDRLTALLGDVAKIARVA